MGIETIAMIGLSAVAAASDVQQGGRNAAAAIQEGNLKTQQEAVQTENKASNLTTSFLSSGIALKGTAMNVVDQAYNSGLQGINQTAANYNTAAKNDVAAGRSKALGQVMGLVGKASIGGAGGLFSDLGNSLPDFVGQSGALGTMGEISSVGSNFSSSVSAPGGTETFGGSWV